jgi:uncharacterized OB-fold protein
MAASSENLEEKIQELRKALEKIKETHGIGTKAKNRGRVRYPKKKGLVEK